MKVFHVIVLMLYCAVTLHVSAAEILVYEKAKVQGEGVYFEYVTHTRKYDYPELSLEKALFNVGLGSWQDHCHSATLIRNDETGRFDSVKYVIKNPLSLGSLYEYDYQKEYKKLFEWEQKNYDSVPLEKIKNSYNMAYWSALEDCERAWYFSTGAASGHPEKGYMAVYVKRGPFKRDAAEQAVIDKLDADMVAFIKDFTKYVISEDAEVPGLATKFNKTQHNGRDYVPAAFSDIISPTMRKLWVVPFASYRKRKMEAAFRGYGHWSRDIVIHETQRMWRRDLRHEAFDCSYEKVKDIGYVFIRRVKKAYKHRRDVSDDVLFCSGRYLISISDYGAGINGILSSIKDHVKSDLGPNDDVSDPAAEAAWQRKEISIHTTALQKMITMSDDWVRDSFFSDHLKAILNVHPVDGFNDQSLHGKTPDQRRAIATALIKAVDDVSGD